MKITVSPEMVGVAVIGGIGSAALVGAAVVRKDWGWAAFHGAIAALCVLIVAGRAK